MKGYEIVGARKECIITELNNKYGALNCDNVLVIPNIHNNAIDIFNAIDKYIRNQNRIEKLKTLI